VPVEGLRAGPGAGTVLRAVHRGAADPGCAAAVDGGAGRSTMGGRGVHQLAVPLGPAGRREPHLAGGGLPVDKVALGRGGERHHRIAPGLC